MLPRASAVPRVLSERGDQLLQETTSAFEVRRAAAGQTLSGFRLKGKALWDEAEALGIQTISALQREMALILEWLKQDFVGGTPAKRPGKVLR